MILEQTVSFLESLFWVIFQTCFHGRRQTGIKTNIAFLLAVFSLTLNIWIADRYVLYTPYTFMGDALILLLYSKICLKDSWYWHIFSVILFYLALFACNFSCITIFTKAFGIPVEILIQPGALWRALFIITTKIVLALTCVLMMLCRKKLETLKNNTIMVFFLPALTAVIVSLMMEVFFNYYQHDGNLLVVAALIIFILLMLLVSSCLLYRVLMEKQRELENHILQKRVEQQEDKYNYLAKYLSQCRGVQHDLKHRLVVVQQLLQKDEWQEGSQYIHTYLTELDGVEDFKVDNTTWKTLIAIKEKKAKDKQINFQTDIACPQKIHIDDTDLCILLGNLLDNAIEAEEQLDTDRELSLYIRERFNIIVIKAGNRIDKSVLHSNPKLSSTKTDHELHGLGMQSIRTIVKKYKGSLKISETEGWFWITIVFNAPEN